MVLLDCSSNGTFVNGELVRVRGSGMPLAAGDRVSLVLSVTPLVELSFTFHAGEPQLHFKGRQVSGFLAFQGISMCACAAAACPWPPPGTASRSCSVTRPSCCYSPSTCATGPEAPQGRVCTAAVAVWCTKDGCTSGAALSIAFPNACPSIHVGVA